MLWQDWIVTCIGVAAFVFVGRNIWRIVREKKRPGCCGCPLEQSCRRESCPEEKPSRKERPDEEKRR